MAVEAARRLARRAAAREPGPHAFVEHRELRLRDDERPQRARRRHDDAVLERGLEAERAERGADVLEAAAPAQAGPLRKALAEGLADLAQVRAPVGEEADEVLVVARGKLDPGRLRGGAVRLCRPPGAGPAGAAAEAGLDEARCGEPLEAVARDVTVDPVVLAELVGGYTVVDGAHKEERGPQPGVADSRERIHNLYILAVFRGGVQVPKLTDKQKEFLDRPYVGVVTTLRDDGSPHATVVWVDREDETVSFNTEYGRRKPAELEADPRVSLLVVDPSSSEAMWPSRWE